MRSTTFHPLSLADFEISPEQGFLPQDPIDNLPDCPTLNELGHELAKLLSARMVRQFINEERSLLSSIPSSWHDQDYRVGMRVLSFAGQTYDWDTTERTAIEFAQPFACTR